MKAYLKNGLAFLIIFCHSLVDAQFNTLTREVTTQKSFSPKIEVQKGEAGKEVKERRHRGKNKIFNMTTKADLKREIDSLKTLMLKYSLSKNNAEKLNFKTREDSLVQIIESSGYSYNSTSKSREKFDLISETEPSYYSKIFMPLMNRIKVTSPYGIRFHPIFGKTKMHNGADLKANYESVHSVMDGMVTEAGWDPAGGGNYIKIRHSNSFVTSYLHLSEVYYKAGELVKAGYIIAKSGNSGSSTGAHLHFAVTENGNYINPIRFLNDLIKANNLIATYYANKQFTN